MKIIKLVTDKKPKVCMVCPISVLHICGKETTVRPTSGAAYKLVIPDDRCKIREAGK
jgi:hypothetical protein